MQKTAPGRQGHDVEDIEPLELRPALFRIVAKSRLQGDHPGSGRESPLRIEKVVVTGTSGNFHKLPVILQAVADADPRGLVSPPRGDRRESG